MNKCNYCNEEMSIEEVGVLVKNVGSIKDSDLLRDSSGDVFQVASDGGFYDGDKQVVSDSKAVLVKPDTVGLFVCSVDMPMGTCIKAEHYIYKVCERGLERWSGEVWIGSVVDNVHGIVCENPEPKKTKKELLKERFEEAKKKGFDEMQAVFEECLEGME